MWGEKRVSAYKVCVVIWGENCSIMYIKCLYAAGTWKSLIGEVWDVKLSTVSMKHYCSNSLVLNVGSSSQGEGAQVELALALCVMFCTNLWTESLAVKLNYKMLQGSCVTAAHEEHSFEQDCLFSYVGRKWMTLSPNVLNLPLAPGTVFVLGLIKFSILWSIYASGWQAFLLVIYYIHFEITGYPYNVIGSQRCDLFPNRTIFCSKSHLFSRPMRMAQKNKTTNQISRLFF